MSRFKIVHAILFLFCTSCFQALAQQNEEENTFENSIKQLGQKVEKLGLEVADRLKDIDTHEIVEEAQHLATLSEKQALRIEEHFNNMNWEGFATRNREYEDGWGETAAYQQSKTIQKVYLISRNTPLTIDNQFGKVEVRTWDKNEIRVDISIRSKENSADKAADILNSVSIEEEKSSNYIRLSTHINRGRTSWWNNIINNDNRGVQINYLISMPKSNTLHVQNKYGAIVLPDLDGEVKVDVSYGSLRAGRLNAANTFINASYSSSEIAAVQTATLDFKYGKMNLGQAKNVQLNLAYCGDSNIDHLSHSGNIDIKYSGGFNLGLGKDINQLNLDAAYSSSVMHIDPNAHFNYDVQVSYGGFDEGASTITHEDPAPDSRGPKIHRSYQGYYGKSSPNQISIDAKYGSISFRD